MPQDIMFKCPECGEQISFLPAYAGKTMPCPECGSAVGVPDPDKEAERRRRGKLFWTLQVVLFIAMCWGITGYLGPPSIRPEMRDVVVSLQDSFRTIELSVRIPLPFVVSYRIKGTDSKSEYNIDSTITKYYLWFFRYHHEIRFRNPPIFLKWIWVF